MEVSGITNKNIWEDFLLECKEKTFLDSWNWGEFQKMMGNKIWRLGVFEGAELLSISLAIKTQARRGTFLFLPHGPNINLKFNSQKPKILETLLDELGKIAMAEKASFIRVAPIWPARQSLGEVGEKKEENNKIFKDSGFREAPIHIHPEVTWELDVCPSEEELLMGLRKTTRYLIRQAQKNKEIEISQSQNIKDMEIFNKLYQEVADRHHFSPFSLNYLKNEFSAFSSDNQISIFFGKCQNEIISSGIFIFWQKIGFYHHGASSLKYPKIPASYLLQWEAIREAKRRGCQIFNFWGIAPNEKTQHPWAGLTLFKMGFGGYKKEYVKTQDFPLSKKYWLTYLFEKLRKTKRGL